MNQRAIHLSFPIPGSILIYIASMFLNPAVWGQSPTLPIKPYDYQQLHHQATEHLGFAGLVSDIDNHTAALGRVLFYDKKLSVNDSIACASCHRQEYAFSDPHRFSTGFRGDSTHRNAMSVVNTAFHFGGFFWDLRAPTLEEQALIPIQDSLEMGMNLDSLTAKLSRLPYYPSLFDSAFGSSEITPARIAFALAEFMRAIVSNRAKFDEGAPIGFTNFTPEEEHGRQLFSTFAQPGSPERGANCFLCHSAAANFSPSASFPDNLTAFASNGLDQFPADDGYGGVTGLPEHQGVFKVPTIRNVQLTAPYMHDGRFRTLEEVVDHYDLGIQDHVNLHPVLRYLGNTRPMRLDLTPDERQALVAFLKTFTDSALINDPRYSDPFNPPTGLAPAHPRKPADFFLGAAYPNPFNPSTNVDFGLPRRGLPDADWVTLQVYDVLGRVVKTLVNERLSPGNYKVHWDGKNDRGVPVASGLYLYRLSSGNYAQTRKMILLR